MLKGRANATSGAAVRGKNNDLALNRVVSKTANIIQRTSKL